MKNYRTVNLTSGRKTAQNRERIMPGVACKTTTYETPALDDANALALFEAATQKYLHMTAGEFLEKWDSGVWSDPDAEPEVMSVVSLLPLVR
jgi:hypothetical protein